jgi:hypothetical protein
VLLVELVAVEPFGSIEMYIHLVYTYTMSSRKSISIRVDPDTLQWFRDQRPRGYQTLINMVLNDFVKEQRLLASRRAGRAQELFRQFHARCFWHYKSDLEITSENMHLVIDGLKKYGGREGTKHAEELCP